MTHPVRTALAAVALTLTAAGCANPAMLPGGPNTLRIAVSSSDRPALQAVADRFQAQHPGTRVSVFSADTDQYQITLRTQFTAGNAPDVVFAWPGEGNPAAVSTLARAGYLVDLSGAEWVRRVPANLRPMLGVEGRTYLAPTIFAGIGAIYNQRTMDQLRLTAPRTWSQLLAFCDTARAHGKVAFALGNQTAWVTQLVDYALVATTVYGDNPRFDAELAAGRTSFAASGWRTAMEKYLQLNARGCFSPNPNGVSFESANRQLGTGRAVAAVQVTAVLGQIQQSAPPGTRFGMFALPATDQPERTRMPGALGGGFAINAASPNQALARQFVDYLVRPAVVAEYARVSAALPAIPDDTFRADPAFATFRTFQKTGRTVEFMDQHWPNAKVQQTHFAVVQDLFAGKTTVPAALARMDHVYQHGK